MSETTATAYATKHLYGRVRFIGTMQGNRYRVVTIGGGEGAWAEPGRTLFVPASQLIDIVGDLPSFEGPEVRAALPNLISRTFKTHAADPDAPDYFLCGTGARHGAPVAQHTTTPVDCTSCLRKVASAKQVEQIPAEVTATPAALPETWYTVRGTATAHYATNTEQDERDGVVRPICGLIRAWGPVKVRETREADIDCPACADELGNYYIPRPEPRPENRAARVAAYLAMAMTASRMSEARERGDKVGYADLRTSMNDLRAAFSISLGTPLEDISRDGYAYPVA